MENKIKDFIGKAIYDDVNQIIWGEQKDGTWQMICEIRGWSRIQNLFSCENGEVNFERAEEFQDELGKRHL